MRYRPHPLTKAPTVPTSPAFSRAAEIEASLELMAELCITVTARLIASFSLLVQRGSRSN